MGVSGGVLSLHLRLPGIFKFMHRHADPDKPREQRDKERAKSRQSVWLNKLRNTRLYKK